MWNLLRRRVPHESEERADLLEYYVGHRSAIEHCRNSLHIFVLDYLREYGPLSLNQLASDTGLHPTAMQQVLDKLRESRFVSIQDQIGQWAVSTSGKNLLNRVLEVDQVDLRDFEHVRMSARHEVERVQNSSTFAWVGSRSLVYARSLGMFFLGVSAILLTFLA